MPRKPAHEQFDTIKAITDHAFELFGRYGYEGVSIGDIASAAKLSKGALYWHFDGKEALYLDCLKRLHAIFDQYVFDPMRAEADPVLAVMHVFSGLQKLLRDPRVEKGVAGYWLIPSRPETAALTAAQRSFEDAAIEVLRHKFQEAGERGLLELSGEADEMARAVIALIEACVVPLRQYSADEMRGILAVLARTLFRAYAKTDDLLKLALAI
ncbi:TetR/AcrR family transcriptional regulator [Solimonas marina]|uniref:TetR/AcrR family transcriptional regulator n=1 Tax=Solimonas marina TaxID=2714601 RepID=A0A970B9K1_9GAMM|nr:TetR/AcrR family transcriptional regulator [Solimonas marina]NKF23424.1 TetR/AcrR family transcriptional regulator [Solimonas marina]